MTKKKEDDVQGIEGQILYPARVVDAERAGRWAAGKEDFLTDEEADQYANRDESIHRVLPPDLGEPIVEEETDDVG